MSAGPAGVFADWHRLRRDLSARVLAQGIVLALPTGMILALGYHRRWVSEDAFIDLRVVDNLLAGHGPVFNVDERVEAYTNPAWVALLTAWSALGLRPEVGAYLLGLALTAIGLVAAHAGAARLAAHLSRPVGPSAERHGAPLVPLGAAVFVAIPAVWDFSTSGLETGLTFAWMGTSFWLLARERERADSTPTGGRGNAVAVVLGAGPLIRPDLAVFSAGFLAALLVLSVRGAPSPRRMVHRAVVLLAAAMALPATYQIFRMGYFAALVPNTALAKEAGRAYWWRGLRYGWDFVGVYALWVPLPLLAGWWTAQARAIRRRRDWDTLAVWLAPVAAAAIHSLYVVRVGGDFMHGRFFLPGLFGLLLPLAVVRLPLPRPAQLRTWAPGVTAGILLAWTVACALLLRVPYAGEGTEQIIADERGVYVKLSGHPHPVTAENDWSLPWAQDGRGLREIAARSGRTASTASSVPAPDPGSRALVLVNGRWKGAMPLAPDVAPDIDLVAVRSNVGLTGYLAGPRVHLVDRLGLGDPLASRLALTKRGRAGHEKALTDPWVIARFAHPDAAPASPAIQSARAALGCGELRALLDAVEEPLSARRFLRNLRLAWTLHDLRIPVDPSQAERSLCATG